MHGLTRLETRWQRSVKSFIQQLITHCDTKLPGSFIYLDRFKPFHFGLMDRQHSFGTFEFGQLCHVYIMGIARLGSASIHLTSINFYIHTTRNTYKTFTISDLKICYLHLLALLQSSCFSKCCSLIKIGI